MVSPDSVKSIVDAYPIALAVLAMSIVPYQIPVSNGMTLVDSLTSRDLFFFFGVRIRAIYVLKLVVSSVFISVIIFTSIIFLRLIIEFCGLFWLLNFLIPDPKIIINILFILFVGTALMSLVFLLYTLIAVMKDY